MHSSGDSATEFGLKKLEEGRTLLEAVSRATSDGDLSQEDHERLRNTHAILRSAMNWLEGSDHFETAHAALDEAGKLARTFYPEGCTLEYEDSTYFITCPVALAHNRIAFSPGMIVHAMRCTICGLDPEDCPHIAGRVYDGQRCLRELTELEILEVSLVARPAVPDARIMKMSVDTADIRAVIGDEFQNGLVVTCDRCLGACEGVVYPFNNVPTT